MKFWKLYYKVKVTVYLQWIGNNSILFSSIVEDQHATLASMYTQKNRHILEWRGLSGRPEQFRGALGRLNITNNALDKTTLHVYNINKPSTFTCINDSS